MITYLKPHFKNGTNYFKTCLYRSVEFAPSEQIFSKPKMRFRGFTATASLRNFYTCVQSTLNELLLSPPRAVERRAHSKGATRLILQVHSIWKRSGKWNELNQFLAAFAV